MLQGKPMDERPIRWLVNENGKQVFAAWSWGEAEAYCLGRGRAVDKTGERARMEIVNEETGEYEDTFDYNGPDVP